MRKPRLIAAGFTRSARAGPAEPAVPPGTCGRSTLFSRAEEVRHVQVKPSCLPDRDRPCAHLGGLSGLRANAYALAAGKTLAPDRSGSTGQRRFGRAAEQ